MGIKQGSGYCHRCDAHVLTQKTTPNHTFHLLLSIITFGLWLIVWFFLPSGVRRCTQCGQDMDSVKNIGTKEDQKEWRALQDEVSASSMHGVYISVGGVIAIVALILWALS